MDFDISNNGSVAFDGNFISREDLIKMYIKSNKVLEKKSQDPPGFEFGG